jgi:RNA polymerase sigma factor (sigma-70 family)
MNAELDTTILDNYLSIHRYCRSQFPNFADAADCAADAITKALRYSASHPAFVAHHWKAWLWRIVRNTISDHKRLETRRNTLCPQVPLEYEDSENDHIGYDTDYAADLARQELAQLLRILIVSRLTEAQRTTIILHYYEGLAPATIAAFLYPDQDHFHRRMRATSLLKRARSTLKIALSNPPYSSYFEQKGVRP